MEPQSPLPQSESLAAGLWPPTPLACGGPHAAPLALSHEPRIGGTALGLGAVLAIIVLVRPWRRPVVFFGFGVVVVLLLLLIPSVHAARKAAMRSHCDCNLKQLGQALQTYHDRYKCFPPAYIADADGRPMHSWRVLLLPCMEQEALYDRYDFNEPWDGPHNRLLARSMPENFHCPADVDALPGEVSYVAVVDAATVWPGNRAVSIRDIKDGTSSTIQVIEAVGLGINWLEPRDLPFRAVRQGIAPPGQPGIGCNHRPRVRAISCDGSTRSIEAGIPQATFEALFTRAGGEAIDGF